MSHQRRCSLFIVVTVSFIFGFAPLGNSANDQESDATVDTMPQLDISVEEVALRLDSGDSLSIEDVEAALLRAGFSIMEDDLTIRKPSVQTNQGLIFEAWEIEAMFDLLRRKVIIPLTYFTDALTTVWPELLPYDIGHALYDGIKDRTSDDHPGTSFWASIILELSRRHNGNSHWQLSETGQPPPQLDAFQVALLLRRLAGDLWIFSHAEDTVGALPVFSVINDSSIRVYPASNHTSPKLPCSLGESEGIIMEAAAVTTTKAFDKILDLLKAAGHSGADKLANRISKANTFLSLTKLFWSISALNVTITMDPPGPPLVRTKNSVYAGQKRHLQARVSYHIGNAQMMNCFRIMLNGAGMDFDLPSDGPAKDAPVDWVIVKGGGLPMGSDRFVEWASSDLGVKTDAQGISRIAIQGARQKKDFPEDSARPVRKVAGVQAWAAVQPANIFLDLLAAADTGLPVNPVGIAVELLLRVVKISGSFGFDVTDWGVHTHDLDIDVSGLDILPYFKTLDAYGVIPMIYISGENIYRGEGLLLQKGQLLETVAPTCTPNQFDTELVVPIQAEAEIHTDDSGMADIRLRLYQHPQTVGFMGYTCPPNFPLTGLDFPSWFNLYLHMFPMMGVEPKDIFVVKEWETTAGSSSAIKRIEQNYHNGGKLTVDFTLRPRSQE